MVGLQKERGESQEIHSNAWLRAAMESALREEELKEKRQERESREQERSMFAIQMNTMQQQQQQQQQQQEFLMMQQQMMAIMEQQQPQQTQVLVNIFKNNN
jgi:hypothetical protein